jgi:hypothetical protein
LSIPEGFIDRVSTVLRDDHPALRDDQVKVIATLYAEQEDASPFPIWEYQNSVLVSEYMRAALVSMQGTDPDRFKALPTANDYVTRALAAGAVLSAEEKLQLARSVETMPPAELLSRFEKLGEAIEARKPIDQSHLSARERLDAVRRKEGDQVRAANANAHLEVQKNRGVEFDRLHPSERLNIFRRSQAAKTNGA